MSPDVLCSFCFMKPLEAKPKVGLKAQIEKLQQERDEFQKMVIGNQNSTDTRDEEKKKSSTLSCMYDALLNFFYHGTSNYIFDASRNRIGFGSSVFSRTDKQHESLERCGLPSVRRPPLSDHKIEQGEIDNNRFKRSQNVVPFLLLWLLLQRNSNGHL
ncbi:hypothetical protein L1987_35533 [Smallanthus sonchifolius]|uniref:Uncharacterized protein n=1 Tax=Smallanthus sonchifolius TaxID=185202 RepID=A0ACB9HXC8_9ASTR|nr:hypothetical protein L1987_35533 [Smallanthus sonchifolius]